MRAVVRRGLSFANVTSLLALFVALGGTSYAVATTFGSKQIRNNSLRSVDVRNNDLRGRDVRNQTLTGADVAADTLTGADVQESSLGPVPDANRLGGRDATGFLQQGAAASGDLAGTYPSPSVAANAITGAKVADG